MPEQRPITGAEYRGSAATPTEAPPTALWLGQLLGAAWLGVAGAIAERLGKADAS